jgi:hypothetical protein
VKVKILCLILMLTISMLTLSAQHRIIGGCGGDPPPTPTPTPTPPPPPPPPPPPTCPLNNNLGPGTKVPAPWGFYFWQLGMFSQVANLSTEMDFDTNPGGLVQIPIPASGSLPCTMIVHEIHGTLALEDQGLHDHPTCGGFNSMVATIVDQNGNTIATGSLMQGGTSSANISVNGKFNTPLSVTSLMLNFSLSPGCNSVLSWQLAMS